MKYIFIAEWDKDFVKSCAKKDISCANVTIAFVKSNYKGKLILATHDDFYCQWIAPDFTAAEAAAAHQAVCEYLVDHFDLANDLGVLTVRYNVYGSDVIYGGNLADATPQSAPQEEQTTPTKHSLTARIEGLVEDLIAADEFKALIQEIAKVAPTATEEVLGEIYSHRHYLFSVDEGYDVKGYVRILSDALHQSGLYAEQRLDLRYRKLDKAEEKRNDPVGEFISDLEDFEYSLVLLDINEWIDSVRTEAFHRLLQAVDNQTINVVVFQIPYVDRQTLNRVTEAISDVLNVRPVSFAPFSKEELQLCAERYLRSFDAELTEDAWRVFHSLILREKSDGNFYGENTVKKVCRDILSAKAVYNADNGATDFTIDAASIEAIVPQESKERNAQEMLDSMIGMDAVRQKLYEIVEQIDASRQFADMEMPSVHMRFVGNPGTGKTTVARIMGRMLKERGLLRIGDLYEIHGRDLVGRYIGETAPKTASICRDSYGSVLFIDEAYSLCRSTEDTKDFGREALDTLIAQMENHRQDLVVIMAGYTDDIANMMKANAGLENRMPYLIEFPNYSREDLYEIFCAQVRRYGKYEEDLLEAAKPFFIGLPDALIGDKSFGNGRFVRNLFERTRAKAITRRQLEQTEELILKKQDFAAATSDSEFRSKAPSVTRRIGFN